MEKGVIIERTQAPAPITVQTTAETTVHLYLLRARDSTPAENPDRKPTSEMTSKA